MKYANRFFLKVLFTSIALIAGSLGLGLSANVTLRWDANVPAPEGYRVFAREGSQAYNYDNPIWEENNTTCTLIGLSEGVSYHFVVRAYDGELESADSAEVSYTPAGVVPNQAPFADAGQNQTVYENESVTLDGSGSSDADGSIIEYHWAQSGGTGVSLDNASAAQPSFPAPVVGINGETLTFSLTVTDDDGSTSISSTTVSVLKSSSTDIDGDTVPDVLDAFPYDPSEWADNDNDGTGNNQDTDDDNDGMTDDWEITYGLNPLLDDSHLDADGDGVSNIDEFQADTNPTTSPANAAPDAPVIDTATQIALVHLTPVLVSGAYFDTDHDDHAQSRWQISTESDFGTLVLDETTATQLTAYTVGEMVLDAETVYYWRVRFFDSRNGLSDWSDTSAFWTIDNPDDANTNGIPDGQEVDASADVNENGISDYLEDNIMAVNTLEGQSIVGIEVVTENVSLVSIKSIPTDTLADQSVKMGFGLIGFKLYLQEGIDTVTVKIYFSDPASEDARLYKYINDIGWQVYSNAVFAPNRKSVTLILEDGGIGDEDGVKNGVIVDPSGISDPDSVTSDIGASISTGSSSSADSSIGSGCFISTGTQDLNLFSAVGANATMLLMILATGFVFAAACRVTNSK
jgi:chitinase